MENEPADLGQSRPDRTPGHPLGRWLRGLPNSYVFAGVLVFVVITMTRWMAHVDPHEMLYLLGSRRVADPVFLAVDFTWSKLPSTSIIFDHLLAPLWKIFDEFTIVNLGRFVSWVLFSWSITTLAWALKLPAWSAVVGMALWLAWRQTLAMCGSPLEGFQVKSFSYPLAFFSLAFAVRGRMAWSGAAAGAATVFHIIVGGWSFLAVLVSMLFNRALVSYRQIAVYLLCAMPFLIPFLLYVALTRAGHASAAEGALMDRIYVMLAMPHCCDPDYFMGVVRWIRAGVVFAIAPIVILAWPDRRVARLLGAYVAALILFFLSGVVARRLELYSVLQLYPFQLANSLPALFVFMFVPAWITMRSRLQRAGQILAVLVVGGTFWLLYNREAFSDLVDTPAWFFFQASQDTLPRPQTNKVLYEWIRDETPRNSVFVTPSLNGFWPYAERAQVASLRHPPLDRRLIEWEQRLQALNGFKPFTYTGLEIDEEITTNVNRMPIQTLIRLRELYGATHYLSREARQDLAEYALFSSKGYTVFDVARMRSGAAAGVDSVPPAAGR